MTAERLKLKVQAIIVSLSFLLMAGKFTAFFLTNSVGILTDAMESIVNVTAGFISLYSIWLAAKPKDFDHPFGHGKIELISASIEGILIIVAGILIIYEGIRRLFTPSVIEQLDTGIWIVAVSGLVNYIAGWISISIGKRHNSIALIASGKHLQSDTYSTIGLVFGLLLLYYTKIPWIDSALVLLFGSVIVLTGINILRKTIANLLDKADDDILKTALKNIAECRTPDWIDVHNMKVIKSGNTYFIECDLTLPWYYTVAQGHTHCDALKAAIQKGFTNNIIALVHTDPCKEQHCPHCSIPDCPHRQHPFSSLLQMTLKELTENEEETTKY